LKTAEHIK